jgi:hypothetical protein
MTEAAESLGPAMSAIKIAGDAILSFRVTRAQRDL